MPTVKNKSAEADWFAAFGDATRLIILRLLAVRERLMSELRQPCAAESMGLTHHLAVLERAGLVTGERVGRQKLYRLVGGRVDGAAVEFIGPTGGRVRVPLV